MTLTQSTRTVTNLPTGYSEAGFMRLTEAKRLVSLNVAALGVMVVAGAVFWGIMYVYHRLLDGPLIIDSLPDSMSRVSAILLMIAIIPLHEFCHGITMSYYGHEVRYGIKWRKGVVYATTDNGLFWRSQFMMIALAPLVFISLIAIFLSLFLPIGFSFWLLVAASLNAAGAIGDIYMIYVGYPYPPDALIRDEEDGMRIYTPS
jgi:hypothetical protein